MNFTGRGRPCTFGFATRGSRATRQFAMKNSAKAASAAPAIQPPQLRRGAAGSLAVVSGTDWSVLIWLSPFLSEAVDEVRVDPVGVQRASNQVAGTHPGTAGPLTEGHASAGRSRCGGHHLHPFQRFFEAS